MNKKQYDLIDEIQSIIESKVEIAPINTLGKGHYLYNFNSFGFDGKFNNTEGVSGEVSVTNINLDLEDDPNMEQRTKLDYELSKLIDNIEVDIQD